MDLFMHKAKPFHTILIVFLSVFIISCGGGGGSDSGNNVVKDEPPAASLTGLPELIIDENTQYSFTVSHKNFSNSLTYTIENSPLWASFDTATGELSGKPNFEQAGVYENIIISASDGTNSATLPAFSIEVVNVNRLPVVTVLTEYEVLESEIFSIALNISDADLDELSITLEEQPEWLNVDVESLSLVGQTSLTSAGSYQVTIIINDGGGEPVTTQTTIIVKDAIEISGKVIDGYINGALVYIDVNNNFTFDDGELYTYTVDSGDYQIVVPTELQIELSKVQLRAYIGEGAIDIDRPELDFTNTPITLALPAINLTNEEVTSLEQISGQIISPYSNQLALAVSEQFTSFIAGNISQAQFHFQVAQARRQITEDVIADGNITINNTDSSSDIIENIIFNDFIAINNDLSTVLEQAQTYIDIQIVSHSDADIDNDSINNSVDIDDDGDGHLDVDDLFPYDATEWADTDGDGFGDNGDFYPQDRACYLQKSGNGTDCYSTWLGQQQIELISTSGDDLLFLYLAPGTLLTYDIDADEVINSQEISSVSDMVYHKGHQKLYLGLSDGNIKALSADFTFSDFSAVNGCVNRLIEADEFLVVLDCEGYSGTYNTINSAGTVINNSNNYYDSSRENAWDSNYRRLYHFSDGISPNDIHYRTINANGEISSEIDSPYHGDYSISGPISVSPDGSRILLGSGDIYSMDGLIYERSIAITFDKAIWLSDGSLLLIVINETSTTLQRLSAEYRPLESRVIQGTLYFSEANENGALIVTNGESGLQVENYLPNNDVDNDGIENTLDAFPTDIAASLDTDSDGFPDNWNEGAVSSDSTTNLLIDFFPLDSACWLSEHAINGNDILCDYGVTMPNFMPDEIVGDEDGNVYFLNANNRKIYRWLSDSQSYGNPLTLSLDTSINNSVTKMAYSNQHNRIYIGYTTGEITYFDLESLTPEQHFATTAMSVDGLTAVGNYVLAQDNSGAWESHHIFDENGIKTDSEEWNQYSQTYAWNEYNSRVYFFRDTQSPNDLLYEEINQVLGTIDAEGDSPYHSSTGIRHPIRVFANGTKVILGSGNIYDATDLTLQDSLTLQAIDIATSSDMIISLESGSSNQLRMWDVTTLELVNELDVLGTPLKLLNDGENINIVSLLSDGSLYIEVLYLSDNDDDGIAKWWEDKFSLNDDDASDALLDIDQDGLSNLQEFELNTNPTIADSDADGVNDGDEVNTYQSDPLATDSDNDGLTDGEEVNTYSTNPILTDTDDDGLNDYDELNVYQSNPLSDDTDEDGMNDLFEITHQLDININDASLDTDLDGLVNLDEFTQNTDVNNSDTDNDGLSDGEEVHTYLTQPLNRDSDGDKMPDGWELTYGFNPLDSADAQLDSDDDSHTNLIEFYTVSDPTDVNDVPVPQSWNSYQGNADNSGFIALDINVNNLSLRWSVNVNNSGYERAVVASNGKVFVSTGGNFNNQNITALNAIDGSVVWQNSYGDINSITEPSASDDKVYFQTGGHGDSFLYALDANDGTEVFSSAYGNQWSSYKSPNIFDGNVYVAGGYYGGAYSFSADTGNENWFVNLAQCDNWVPAVNEDNVFYYDESFRIADKTTGAIVASSDDQTSSYSDCRTPVIGREYVFVNTDNGLHAFNSETAELVWQVENSSYNQSFSGTPTAALGKVFALKGGALYVYDEFSGDELWSWEPSNGGSLARNISVTLNHAFVSDSNNTYVININSHQQVWSYPVSGSISFSLEGAIYIQSLDGTIVAINYSGDSDDDGIDDWWEELYGLDINDNSDASLDADVDGLTNLEEFSQGTNPLITDTDTDGISDFDEVNTYLSNPNNTDTDSDGMPDLWEIEQGLDLLNAADAYLDADDDTISNLDEYTQATDPNDAASIPEIISSVTYSFEDGLVPADWLIDQTLASGWGVTALESSDGDNSLFSSGNAAITFSGYFAGNNLTFEAKNSCGYYNVEVYVDEQETPTSFDLTAQWQEYSVIIPAGQHTVRIEMPSCSNNYFDNAAISPLENLFATDTFMVTTDDQQLKFFDADGQLIKQATIPVTDSHYSAEDRDLVILNDGKVAVYNGTYSPSLSIYSPEKHQWQHLSDAEWSTVNNDSYGGIAALDDAVFVTNMTTSYNNSAGLIKIDLTTNTFTFVDGQEFIDLTIGLDGYLYAMVENGVYKYDTETLVLEDTFVISSATSLAVDASGNIYTASLTGNVTQYSSAGLETKTISVNEINSLSYWDSNLQDININDYGDLYITNIDQKIFITESSLETISFYHESTNYNAEFLALLPFIDNDEDGMPAWWENKFALSDDDDTDATTDLDLDGLSNLAEYLAKLNPSNEDSDDDNLTDFAEINTYLTDPLKADTDSDGLTDGDELNTHLTDPLDADSDDDLFSDGDELNYYETDPLDINSVPELDLIDFNSGVIPSTMTNHASSTSEWYIDGGALRSGTISHSQNSSIVYSKTFTEGTLTFDALVSSESCCDRLVVTLDGMTVVYDSTQSTVSHEIHIDAGERSIIFSYTKDGSASSDDDAVWIDNILFTPSS
jgi:outer membrane protein assembly factor BamB